MENTIKKTNKATLIAAALIITGATAIFGTYAAEDEQTPEGINRGPLACYEMVNNMSDEDKAKMDEAHDLMAAGDTEAARAIMEELGLKGPGPRFENLTEEQKAVMEQARELFEAGKTDEAKALLNEAGIKPPRHHGPRAEFIENLTDEQREKFQEAHELMREGEVEAAEAIFDELGLERPEGRPGNGFGRKGAKKLQPQVNNTTE